MLVLIQFVQRLLIGSLLLGQRPPKAFLSCSLCAQVATMSPHRIFVLLFSIKLEEKQFFMACRKHQLYQSYEPENSTFQNFDTLISYPPI